jgi:hypothetical protein
MPTMINLLDLDVDIYTEGLDLFGKQAKAREYVMAQRRYFEGQNGEKERGETAGDRSLGALRIRGQVHRRDHGGEISPARPVR